MNGLGTAAQAAVRRRFLRDDAPIEDPEQRLADLVTEEAPLLGEDEIRRWARHLAVELVGLGPLELLLERPGVTDVLVNGPGEVWVEQDGRLRRSGVRVDRALVEGAIERLVAPLGLQADRTHPVVDGRLADGTRVTVVLPPLAVDGPLLALRRHAATVVPLAAFGTPAVVRVLEGLVEGGANLVVFGATGSGKTTLLNALASRLAPHERVVTIEDVAELRLPGEHVVRLEARPGTADGAGRVALRDLVRVALRLRPDRIVVGEVRGAEALDMVWALSTGHRGCMSTCHATSPPDVLDRITTMALGAGDGLPHRAVQAQVHTAVDAVIGVGRAGSGRRVTSVHAVAADGALVDLSEGT